MKLHEYQAKEIFASYGIPIQKGTVIARPGQVDEIALTYPVVLRAQVLVGGRGKAGGIKLAATPAEAREKARQILGITIKGETVRRLLVAEAADIGAEDYPAFTGGRAARRLRYRGSGPHHAREDRQDAHRPLHGFLSLSRSRDRSETGF